MPGFYSIIVLIGSIGFIIWGTVYKKIHAFFILFIAALAVGIICGIPGEKVVKIVESSFGQTLERIGLIILFGTTLAVILEKTGATKDIANCILKKLGEKNAALAISLSGFIIGLPMFCGSGFIILSGISHTLVARSKTNMPVIAGSLAASLFSVHCLVPPHPGIIAATIIMGADPGLVLVWGLALAIPSSLVGYFWSRRVGSRITDSRPTEEVAGRQIISNNSPEFAFIPLLLPIMLIAVKATRQLAYPDSEKTGIVTLINFLGEPVIALLIGIISSLVIKRTTIQGLREWLAEAVEKSGPILAIIAAGGIFGGMLEETGISKDVGVFLQGMSLGVFFPFLISAIIKTAQGSSTVAVITAASLTTTILPELGLQSSFEVALAVLSAGAGSMVISHANDSFFWVVTKFSKLEVATVFKVYSLATFLMGLAVQLLIWLLIYV